METKFNHRDLSWLEFNKRVLEEAGDKRNPLLERLKFLAIFTSNLDEFFMVRVSGAKKLVDSGYNRKDQFGLYPQELMAELRTRTDGLIKDVYAIYEGETKHDLEANKIFLRNISELNPEQKKFAKRFFDTTLFPIMTPMAVDQGHPFPALPSKTLAFAVSIVRGEKAHLAILPIPKVVPRMLRVPSEGDEFCFILVDSLIKENLGEFFKGFKTQGSCIFRLLRDSELAFDEEYAPNLLKAMEKELKKRPTARVVHLEMESATPKELQEALCAGIEFPKEDVTFTESDLDLSFLWEVVATVDRPDLRFPSFSPAKIPYENIFDKIKEEDFIVHMPFQSFYPTVDLIAAAAKDPDVLAIKMTLYRTDEESGIIKGLMEAAKRRKQVTVVVEIKARFEEEKNIQWARELELAGCHVIYGIAGLKIHSKMTLIVRKEEGRIRRYVHLATGNYNEKTARIYTDIGYFTTNDDFARDIADVFNVITGYSLPSPWKRVISSPHDLRKYFFDMVDKEIAFHQINKNGAMTAKMNSLEDSQIIEKLYEASQAGVKIKLIVRGICALVPGVKGLSENIKVKSVVGRFLEHSRMYVFNNDGNPRVFLSSADWMTRNFDRRIELLFEITKPEIKTHLQFILDTYWKDSRKARKLKSDGTYERSESEGEFNAQEYFINHYTR
jgi:polyphosphate kinase